MPIPHSVIWIVVTKRLQQSAHLGYWLDGAFSTKELADKYFESLNHDPSSGYVKEVISYPLFNH